MKQCYHLRLVAAAVNIHPDADSKDALRIDLYFYINNYTCVL